MNTEAITKSVKESVSTAIERVLTEATEQRMSIFKEAENNDDKDMDKDKDTDKSGKKDGESDDEDEDDEDEDDEPLEEGLKVVGVKTAKGSKAEDLEVKDMRELTKLAKTGTYGWFMVTKKNGDEDEYTVEKGKLVLM